MTGADRHGILPRMGEEHPKSAVAASAAVTIEADRAVAPGVYSNLMMITHRKGEFVLDFLFVQPQRGPRGEAVATLRSRVIATPEHTKRVLRALEENVRKYEAAFGVIEEVTTDIPTVLQ